MTAGAAAHQWHGLFLAMEGRVEDAGREIAHALEVEPLSVVTGALRGFQLNLAGEHERELAQFQSTVELDPNHFLGYWGLGIAYEHAGRIEDSVSALRRAAALAEHNPIVSAVLARAEALAGRPDDARRTLAGNAGGAAAHPSDYQRAAVDLALGRSDEALRRLEAAAAAREPWMVLLRIDPMFAELRDAPRFQALVARVFASH
jgi:tetratricopeptide (TPR) repeat protein